MLGGCKRRGVGGVGTNTAMSSAAVMVVVVVACLCAVVKADEMARIRQKHLATTSSTLKWAGVGAGEPLPYDALKVNKDNGGGVWCRFTDHGSVAGVVKDGICHAPFLDTVSTLDKYEVLVSINDSARIVEKEWSIALWMSGGGVMVDKNRVLAVAHTPDGLVLPGYADAVERKILLLNGSEVVSYDVAMILTEEEPVEYKMDGITWEEGRPALEDEEQVLANLTLENADDEPQVISKQVDFTVAESLYFGNVRGTVKGLNATVTGPGGHVWRVTWGANSDFKREDQQTVSLEVPGKAVVDVKLVGVVHRFKSPYTAKLSAVYKDGETRVRSITAPHEHVYLAEIRADFSRPRSITTGEEMTGDFPTSEILVASTTTTSTTTTIPPPPGAAATGGDNNAVSLSTSEPNLAPPALLYAPHLLTACFVFLLINPRP